MASGLLWLPLFVGLLGYFAYVHSLNELRPIQRVPIRSFDQVRSDERQALLVSIPPLTEGKAIRLRLGVHADADSVELTIPHGWEAVEHSGAGRWWARLQRAQVVRSSDSVPVATCVDVLFAASRMPLLEAFAFSPLMTYREGVPYFSKDVIITSINGQPAVLSQLRNEGMGEEAKDTRFVLNALVEWKNHGSFVMRNCSGSDETLFYQIYKSIKFTEAGNND
jgi:hypothetical protein